jgi:hypothetical protein
MIQSADIRGQVAGSLDVRARWVAPSRTYHALVLWITA